MIHPPPPSGSERGPDKTEDKKIGYNKRKREESTERKDGEEAMEEDPTAKSVEMNETTDQKEDDKMPVLSPMKKRLGAEGFLGIEDHGFNQFERIDQKILVCQNIFNEPDNDQKLAAAEITTEPIEEEKEKTGKKVQVKKAANEF